MTQQLTAIRRRIADSVVPELPADARFAREQVMLIDAALGLVIDSHEHEYRLAVLDYHEYRSLLEEFARLAGEGSPSLPEQVADGPAPDAGALPLAAVEERTRWLKEETARRYSELARRPSTAAQAGTLLAGVAARQVDREASWYRGAGFTADAPPLTDLLGEATPTGCA
ncbi:hypothetical protein ACL02T_22365 [Pseudonocardia sp. RS010]|uniref:hypothetical protein n=1 Tax=Pseudonocardia sp. RS010 TaxID=3385979 RepID=UPI00399F8CDE